MSGLSVLWGGARGAHPDYIPVDSIRNLGSVWYDFRLWPYKSMLISCILIWIMIEPNRAIRIKYGLWDNRERGYPATHSIVDDWVMEDRVNRIEASRGWSRVGTAPVASTWNLPHLPTIKTLCIVSDDQQSRMRTCLCPSPFLTWHFDRLDNEAMRNQVIEVFGRI